MVAMVTMGRNYRKVLRHQFDCIPSTDHRFEFPHTCHLSYSHCTHMIVLVTSYHFHI